jgi:hypothetical protein
LALAVHLKGFGLAEPATRQQHNACAHNDLLRRLAIGDEPLQCRPVTGPTLESDGHREFERRAPAASNDAIFTGAQRGFILHEMMADRLPIYHRSKRAAEV